MKHWACTFSVVAKVDETWGEETLAWRFMVQAETLPAAITAAWERFSAERLDNDMTPVSIRAQVDLNHDPEELDD